MSDRYPLSGWISVYAERHQPDDERGGCICGFCAWSPDHVAIAAYREAVDAAEGVRHSLDDVVREFGIVEDAP